MLRINLGFVAELDCRKFLCLILMAVQNIYDTIKFIVVIYGAFWTTLVLVVNFEQVANALSQV